MTDQATAPDHPDSTPAGDDPTYRDRLVEQRIEKLTTLRVDVGINPYGRRTDGLITIAAARDQFVPDIERDQCPVVKTAGRVMPGQRNDRRFSRHLAVGFRKYLDPRGDYEGNYHNPRRDQGDKFLNAKSYKCPSHPNKKHNISYIINGLRFDASGRVNEGNSNHGSGRYAHRIDMVRWSSQVVYITEFEDDESDYFYNNCYNNQWNVYGDRGIAGWHDTWRAVHVTGRYSGTGGRRIHDKRHGTGSNVLYMDGHADYRTDNYILDLKNWDDGLYGFQRMRD